MKEFRSFHKTTGPSPETMAHTRLIGNKGFPGSFPTTLNKLQACCCQDAEKMRNTRCREDEKYNLFDNELLIHININKNLKTSCTWASFFTIASPFPEIKAHKGRIGDKGLPRSLPSKLNELQAHCYQDPQHMRSTIYLIKGY